MKGFKMPIITSLKTCDLMCRAGSFWSDTYSYCIYWNIFGRIKRWLEAAFGRQCAIDQIHRVEFTNKGCDSLITKNTGEPQAHHHHFIHELPPSRQRMSAAGSRKLPPQQTTARRPQPRRSRWNHNHPKPKRGKNKRNQPPPGASHPKHGRNHAPGSRATKGTNETIAPQVTSEVSKWRPMAAEMPKGQSNKPNNKPSHQAEGWASSHNKRCT